MRGLRYIKGSVRSLIDSKKRKARLAHFHVYHFSLLELFNVLLYRAFGIKCVATIHDVSSFEHYGTCKDERSDWKASDLLKLCAGLLVHSQLAFDSVLRLNVPREKLHLVPHGDTDFLYNQNNISRQAVRDKIGCNTNSLILFYPQPMSFCKCQKI